MDVGTNSTRLLVAEGKPGGPLVEIARETVITRLGEGLERKGAIQDGPARRTLEAVALYAARARALGAEALEVFCTAAVREARNAPRFLSCLEEAAAVRPRVLSPEEEAEASFIGAALGLGVRGRVAVADVGGGSTELVLGEAWGPEAEEGPGGRVLAWVSIPTGCVKLTEAVLAQDPPGPEEREALRRAAREEVERGAAPLLQTRRGLEYPAGGEGGSCEELVAVAGTATTMAAMKLGLASYRPEAIHGARVTRSELEKNLERLARMTKGERAALPFMAPGREDVILAGGELLLAVLDILGFRSYLASERDILDGVALELLGRLWRASSGGSGPAIKGSSPN